MLFSRGRIWVYTIKGEVCTATVCVWLSFTDSLFSGAEDMESEYDVYVVYLLSVDLCAGICNASGREKSFGAASGLLYFLYGLGMACGDLYMAVCME